MTGQQKATYALAAFALACATILGALHALPETAIVGLFGMALGAVGWYHALAPGQAQAPPAGGAPS